MIFGGIFRVRRLLRQAKQGATAEQQEKINRILNDADLFNDLMASLHSEHDQHCAIVGVSGPFQDFLDWIIENQDAIIALILKLLPMFV